MSGVATRTVPVDLLPHLRRARDHIDRYYRGPLELRELAAVAGVSKYHFARSFAAAYGETPIRYLTRRRIERAQDLLRSANLTVTEICMAVGFSSLGSFSARFAALVGESPTAYRNRWAALGGPRIPGCYLFMCGALNPAGTGVDRVGVDKVGVDRAGVEQPGDDRAGVEQPGRSAAERAGPTVG